MEAGRERIDVGSGYGAYADNLGYGVYSPDGWLCGSLPDEIRQIIAPYQEQGSTRFSGLTVADAQRIVALLPQQAGAYFNETPTFAQFIDLGKRYPGMTFEGDVLGPGPTNDEEVQIDTFLLPLTGLSAEQYVELREELPTRPNEWDVYGDAGNRLVRAWWD